MAVADKQTVVFILPSIHHVLKAEKLLKATEIPFDLVPVPKEINPDCGMAVETGIDTADEVRTFLNNAGLPVEGVYQRNGRDFQSLD
jgi:hypothetical protein